ncbi:MAG TPA: hypothetical protein VL326_18465, partial [Kofleriaceae bacterium]|nr:hypothetical protein [Kofleriaceae bacterium]
DQIHRQLKSALGALREKGIGVSDRDAIRNLANPTLVRATFDVVGTNGVVAQQVERVRYHYHDQALCEKNRCTSNTVDLTLLYGDFVARAGELIPLCSDDQTTEPDSLWYHYQPGIASCAAAITAERNAIDHDRAMLANATTQLTQNDLDRRFLSTRATLVPQTAAPDKWPEHDQLWGFAGDNARTKIVVYSFFGVDSDESKPTDLGIVEYLRFERELRKRMPSLRVTETNPNAWLLDFYINNQKLPNITWDDVERWVVDGTGFPAAVGSDPAKRAELLRQVVQNFSERWIVWTAPITVTRGSVQRTMTVEIRTWHGWEDGSPDIRLHARWRYLEAFWNADVFSYTGHSHFGHGPLEPWEYSGANFPDRYQVMLINSCLSFNYYDEDFLRMHPGGSAKLDVVVNGLPAYWQGMGQATAAYVAGVTGGSQSWRQVLTSMRVNLPWEYAYDPMRAVNGELDNQFNPSTGAITIVP